MSDERDDLLREIGQLIAIDPSPEFGARVRVETERTPAGVWHRLRTWHWAVAAATIATGLAVIAVQRADLRRPPAAQRPASSATIAERPTEATPAPVPADAPRSRPTPHAAEPVTTVPAADNPAPSQGLDTSVVTNQEEVLRRVWARFNTSREPAPKVTGPMAAPDLAAAIELGPAVVVDEITVTPVAVAQIDDDRGDFSRSPGISIH